MEIEDQKVLVFTYGGYESFLLLPESMFANDGMLGPPRVTIDVSRT